jgi:mannose/cellobiose epimerase-like protein (N-acyl-D-glucosamine 2-epimerase family)
MTAQMRALYESALRHGAELDTGLLYNQIWPDGQLKEAAKRLWPQTERLKAECALSLADAPASVDRVFRHFLDPARPGAWIDRLDSANVPLKANIPASSLYHLFMAFTEYLGRQTP